VIEVSETTLKMASPPQKLTEVVPLKDVPVIATDDPDGPWTGEMDETYGVDWIASPMIAKGAS